MPRKILVGFSALIFIFAVVVMLLPSEFKISRTEKIKAAPFVVFNNVNNFHIWPEWSPWAKLDPNMTTTFDGSESGVGAVYAWKGDDKVGAGRMSITESNSNEKIVINLEFIKPFQTTNLTEFDFTIEGDITSITWSMSGHRGFFEKVFNIFMDLDKLVGGDFEKGLSQLKIMSESEKIGHTH